MHNRYEISAQKKKQIKKKKNQMEIVQLKTYDYKLKIH